MARLTYVYRTEDISYVNIGRRQLPVIAGENLMMLMDLNSKGLSIDSPQIRGKELEEFTRKFNLLTSDELRDSLEIDSAEFVSVLNQCVQCVGCRRSVERLFYQLTLSGHPTLDPLVLKTSCILSIAEEKQKTPQALGTVLYRHHEILNNLVENKLRNKTRCVLHSLDTFRTKPFSETWREVWSSMKHNCRDELAVIETKELHEVLDNYLKKHKFCQGCRTKIEKAYNLLIGETTTKEKGFVTALYANIKKCHPDKHIHVVTNKIDFLDALIRRAEPEVNGSFAKQRERHAKTLEIAQEEVLTCVGMIMYERLRRIYVSLREEERACQMLAAVGVHALCRSFDISVEKKQGISNLELLYQEISRAEKAREHKREQKKLKKKKRKNEKKMSCNTSHDTIDDIDDDVDDSFNIIMAEEPASIMVTTSMGQKEKEHALDMNVPSSPAVGDTNEATVNASNHVAITSPSIKQKKTAKQNIKQKGKQQHQQQPKTKKKQQNVSSTKACITKGVSAPDERASIVLDESSNGKCVDCQEPSSNCPCEIAICTKSVDAGYATDPHSHLNSRTSSVASSPEGSVVSCSDGCCSHEPPIGVSHTEEEEAEEEDDRQRAADCTAACCQQSSSTQQSLSLLQMLDDFGDDYDDENCYIPQEVVLEFQCQRERVQQQRQQLRETLKQNFARLCMRSGLAADKCK